MINLKVMSIDGDYQRSADSLLYSDRCDSPGTAPGWERCVMLRKAMITVRSRPSDNTPVQYVITI